MNNAILLPLTLGSVTQIYSNKSAVQVISNFNKLSRLAPKKIKSYEEDNRPLISINGWFYHTRVLISISTMQ